MRERCIRQFVLIVAKRVKFPLSLTQTDLFSVESAIQKEDPQIEDFRLS
jgi:hypothetical protein